MFLVEFVEVKSTDRAAGTHFKPRLGTLLMHKVLARRLQHYVIWVIQMLTSLVGALAHLAALAGLLYP